MRLIKVHEIHAGPNDSEIHGYILHGKFRSKQYTGPMKCSFVTFQVLLVASNITKKMCST